MPRIIWFRSRMRIREANPFIPVSAALARRIKPGWRKAMPVLIRVNKLPAAKPWRINLMPVGDGSYYLYLHGLVRRASGTKVGDVVRVDVQFDDAYRNGPMHAMPTWFRAELARHPDAKAGWASLIPSRKKEILRYIAGLKSPAARARNLKRAMRVLAGKKGRYMARDW